MFFLEAFPDRSRKRLWKHFREIWGLSISIICTNYTEPLLIERTDYNCCRTGWFETAKSHVCLVPAPFSLSTMPEDDELASDITWHTGYTYWWYGSWGWVRLQGYCTPVDWNGALDRVSSELDILQYAILLQRIHMHVRTHFREKGTSKRLYTICQHIGVLIRHDKKALATLYYWARFFALRLAVIRYAYLYIRWFNT